MIIFLRWLELSFHAFTTLHNKSPIFAIHYYSKMMINQENVRMFACCYYNKEGHLPAHSAKPANFPYERDETDFSSFFQGREWENLAQL